MRNSGEYRLVISDYCLSGFRKTNLPRNSYHRFMNCKLYLDRNQVYGSDEDKLLICCNL